MASDELLATVHDPAYMEAVRLAGKDPYRVIEERGLGTADNPTFEGMHEASAHVVGATVEAARRVWTGEVLHAANISGGLHHAMPDRASGFCVYNDVAVGIRWLLDHGRREGGVRRRRRAPRRRRREGVLRRPAGAHHQPARDRPDAVPRHRLPHRHRRPRARRAARSTWRCRPGTSDAGWLRAFHAVVPPLVREFAPDVLVTQQGCDSHIEDPLAHLMLTVDGQRAAYLALHDLAHEVCDGRWVVTGGGGYAVVDVVPRSWTHLLAIVGGAPLDPQTATPEAWREHVAAPAGAHRAVPDDRRPHAGVPRLVAAATTRRSGWTGRSTRPGRRSSRSNGLDHQPTEPRVTSSGLSTRHAGSYVKTLAESSPLSQRSH